MVAWLALAVGAGILGSACVATEPVIDEAEEEVGTAEERQIRRGPWWVGCASPFRRYVSRSPASCAAIRFYCPEGRPFFDQCGCGCLLEPTRGPGNPGGPPFVGERCGQAVCNPGMVCCNASCGICTPPGGACIQIACD